MLGGVAAFLCEQTISAAELSSARDILTRCANTAGLACPCCSVADAGGWHACMHAAMIPVGWSQAWRAVPARAGLAECDTLHLPVHRQPGLRGTAAAGRRDGRHRCQPALAAAVRA
jgi:hypothetical protein